MVLNFKPRLVSFILATTGAADFEVATVRTRAYGRPLEEGSVLGRSLVLGETLARDLRSRAAPGAHRPRLLAGLLEADRVATPRSA